MLLVVYVDINLDEKNKPNKTNYQFELFTATLAKIDIYI